MLAHHGIAFKQWRFERPQITRHNPPLIYADRLTGEPFQVDQTYRDSAGNVWAARMDLDAAMRRLSDDGYDPTMPQWVIVELAEEQAQ